MQQIAHSHNAKLQRLYRKAVYLLNDIEFMISHVKREWNTGADYLANQAMNKMRTTTQFDNDSQCTSELLSHLHQDIQHAQFPPDLVIQPEIDKDVSLG